MMRFWLASFGALAAFTMFVIATMYGMVYVSIAAYGCAIVLTIASARWKDAGDKKIIAILDERDREVARRMSEDVTQRIGKEVER